MNKYFAAEQREKELEIIIYGDITSWEWFESDMSSYTLSKLLNGSDAEKITVKINSMGGDVAEGMAIYNELREKSRNGAEVITVAMGFACSAAAAVFCAGDRRVMQPASMLFLHNAWTYAVGNAEELRKQADDLEKISSAMEETYRKVTSLEDEEMKGLLDGETWILPSEALEYGFATEIADDDGQAQASTGLRQSAMANMMAQLGRGSVRIKPEQLAKGTREPGQGTQETGEPFSGIFKNFKKRSGTT